MTAAGRTAKTVRDLDAIALRFLGSEFAEPVYADWPIERRLDAYLRHNRLIDVDQRVMANLSRTHCSGIVHQSNRPEQS